MSHAPDSSKAVKVEPPAGPPWDTPLGDAPLAFVDLEMTGLDAKRDRVVEICIERVRHADVDAPTVEQRLHTLVRPSGGEVGNMHVHGIDAAALEGAPTFSEIAVEVAQILEQAVFIAHGAKWDVAFLEAEMRRCGHQDFKIPIWLDTLHLSRRAFGLHKHSLDALRTQFGLDTARAHRADADVAALRSIFARCVEALEPTTPRDLWQVRVAERRVREHVVAQCKDAVAAGREVTVVYRARARPAEPMRMVLTSVEVGLDPPRVIGYQLPGRGRRELRADRILRIEPIEPIEPERGPELLPSKPF